MDDDLKSLIDGFDSQAFYKELAKAFGKEGWTYRDVPWTHVDIFDSFFNQMGAEISLLSCSERTEGDRKWKRGQCLISPHGMHLLTNGKISIN